MHIWASSLILHDVGVEMVIGTNHKFLDDFSLMKRLVVCRSSRSSEISKIFVLHMQSPPSQKKIINIAFKDITVSSMVWHVYHFLGDFFNTWLDGQIMDGPIGYTLLDSTIFAMSPLILNFLQDTPKEMSNCYGSSMLHSTPRNYGSN